MSQEKVNNKTVEASQNELVVKRIFDAPRDLVFEAWSQPEHLAEWWGPKGYTMQIAKFDLRPGGIFHYNQRSPEGEEAWGKFDYREIVKPEKLVFTNSFSDEEGNTVRAPFNPAWPLEILNTLTFS
ncbi:MAG TPA: SRPBCC domain-containing protein, partial [Bacillales bacterium]|nr:SRPBCC domain-containing protein [Bacillales bacterium]